MREAFFVEWNGCGAINGTGRYSLSGVPEREDRQT